LRVSDEVTIGRKDKVSGVDMNDAISETVVLNAPAFSVAPSKYNVSVYAAAVACVFVGHTSHIKTSPTWQVTPVPVFVAFCNFSVFITVGSPNPPVMLTP
jgi:hypothetical protein